MLNRLVCVGPGWKPQTCFVRMRLKIFLAFTGITHMLEKISRCCYKQLVQAMIRMVSALSGIKQYSIKQIKLNKSFKTKIEPRHEKTNILVSDHV